MSTYARKLFLALSIVGIMIAAMIVVLILLNSRPKLGQYRFASFIEDVQGGLTL